MTGRTQTDEGAADDPLLREALEWLVRLRDEQATTDEQQAFEAWLAKGAPQRNAWAEASRLWDSFEPARAQVQAMRQRDRALSRRDLLRGAGALTLAGAGGWTLLARGERIGTAPGEIRKLTLADGTRITLGARSTLEAPTDGGPLTLHRGGAYFARPQRNGTAPLQVAVAGAEISCATGAFDLALWPDRATLAVARDAVLLRPAGNSATRPLDAGWGTSLHADGMTAPAPVPPTAIGAWRDGRLIFRDAPLAEVFAALDRYRGGRLLCLDAQTRQIPVTAVFDAATPDAALRTVADSLGLSLVPLPGGLTLVRT